MPGQSKVMDLTLGIWDHGMPCCAHIWTGVRITGSSDVIVNDRRASRACLDIAIHDCPHCAVNMCLTGSQTVYINDLRAHRKWDIETEFCGIGMTITASRDVFDDSVS